MQMTQADMASRKRMAEIRAKFSDALDSMRDTEITYAELLIVLSEMTVQWANICRSEELKQEVDNEQM